MDEQTYQISLLEAANRKLKARDRMLSLISDMASDAFVYVNFVDQGFATEGNFELLTDTTIKTIADLDSLSANFSDPEQAKIDEVIHLEKLGHPRLRIECYCESNKHYFSFEAYVIYDQSGEAVEKQIRISDITQNVLSANNMSVLAFSDPLTGLHNRRNFFTLLTDMLERACVESTIVSLILIDIDNFKSINSDYGRAGGDEIIVAFGDYLGKMQSERLCVARLQSDYYGLICYAPDSDFNAKTITESICKRLDKPFAISNTRQVRLSVCMGAADFPEAAPDADGLLKSAETVLLRAKAIGAGSVEFFDLKTFESENKNRLVESNFNKALAEKNFFLNFQPQYSVSEKRLRGVEVLVRWLDSDGTVISPNVFIPIAEKNGTIVELGKWILEDAFATFAEWKSQFEYGITMSLNISPIQYKRDDFVPFFVALFSRYAVKLSEIELEIQERNLVEDWEAVSPKLKQLKEFGVRLSIDDFGRHYAGMEYFKYLNIDTVKFHKSFFLEDYNETSRLVTNSILRMFKQLNICTIALGIEQTTELSALLGIDCEYMQGFLWGRPVSSDEVVDLMCQLMLEGFEE